VHTKLGSFLPPVNIEFLCSIFFQQFKNPSYLLASVAFGVKSAVNLIADGFYMISCYSSYLHDSFFFTLIGIGVDVFEFVLCECYSLDLKCSTRSHVLKAWSPWWQYWEVMESLRGVA
jgi:hypothetical protein